MTEYPAPKMSRLCRTESRDGITVRIDIYEGGSAGWILEVVDQDGNSTVWDDLFPSDQSALDEALRTIRQDGIASVVGSEPSKGSPSQ